MSPIYEFQDPAIYEVTKLLSLPGPVPRSMTKIFPLCAALASYPVGPDPTTICHLAFVLLAFASPAGFTRTTAGTLVVNPKSELLKDQRSRGASGLVISIAK